MKAGVSLYLASKDMVKKLALSWLVAMIMAADRVVASASTLKSRARILLVHFIMELAGNRRGEVGIFSG